VLFYEGAFVVKPFEDDEFTAEVGEVVRGALGVGEGEFRSGFAGFNGGKGEMIEGEGKEGKKKEDFHHSKIPWNVGWSSGSGSKKPVESGRREVEKAKNSGFGVRGHPKHWGAEGSKAKKTALGSEVKKRGSEVMFVNVKVNVNGDFGSG